VGEKFYTFLCRRIADICDVYGATDSYSLCHMALLIVATALKVYSIWWWVEVKHLTEQRRRVSLWHRISPQHRTGIP